MMRSPPEKKPLEKSNASNQGAQECLAIEYAAE